MTEARSIVDAGPADRPKCPVCGTPHASGDRECSICGSPLGTSPAVAGTIVLALVLISIGVAVVLPGLGILFAIASVAPIVRLSMVVRERSKRGLETPRWQQWAIYGSSLGATITIVVTTGIVAFLTFCISCFGGAAPTGSMELGMLVGTLATLVVVGLLIAAWTAWARKRWDRDVGRPPMPD